MGDHWVPLIISVVGGVISLALVSVLMSKNAQTASVLQGAGSALSGVISAAVSPVSGGSGMLNNNFGNASTGALGGFSGF